MQDKVTLNDLLAKAKELKAMVDSFNKDLYFWERVNFYVTDSKLECAAGESSLFGGDDVVIDGVQCTTVQGRIDRLRKRKAAKGDAE